MTSTRLQVGWYSFRWEMFQAFKIPSFSSFIICRLCFLLPSSLDRVLSNWPQACRIRPLGYLGRPSPATSLLPSGSVVKCFGWSAFRLVPYVSRTSLVPPLELHPGVWARGIDVLDFLVLMQTALLGFQPRPLLGTQLRPRKWGQMGFLPLRFWSSFCTPIEFRRAHRSIMSYVLLTFSWSGKWPFC